MPSLKPVNIIIIIILFIKQLLQRISYDFCKGCFCLGGHTAAPNLQLPATYGLHSHLRFSDIHEVHGWKGENNSPFRVTHHHNGLSAYRCSYFTFNFPIPLRLFYCLF